MTLRLNGDVKCHLVQHSQSRVPQPIDRKRKIRNSAFETGLLSLSDPIFVDPGPISLKRLVQEPRADIYAESNVCPWGREIFYVLGIGCLDVCTFVEEVGGCRECHDFSYSVLWAVVDGIASSSFAITPQFNGKVFRILHGCIQIEVAVVVWFLKTAIATEYHLGERR